MFIWLYYKSRLLVKPGRGLSFEDMIMLLAHHSLVVHADAVKYVAITASLI